MNRFNPMATGVLPVRRWLTLLAILVTAILATLALTAVLSSPADAAPPPGKGGGGNSSLEDRLAAVEVQVEAQAKQIEALETENGLLADELARLEAAKATKTELDSAVAPLATTDALTDAEDRIAELERLLAGVTRADDASDRDTLRFSDMNVQIVNGTGTTSGTPTGTGNLIIGYDANRSFGGDIKTGSHYLIVGDGNNYTRFGGIVAGSNNTASGDYASVTGGSANTASGLAASVSGGRDSTASGGWASVSGGEFSRATGLYASVSGGLQNRASGVHASVSGGGGNLAEGQSTSVSGGGSNTASGTVATVSGGLSNTASGNWATVYGGNGNTASDPYQVSP